MAGGVPFKFIVQNLSFIVAHIETETFDDRKQALIVYLLSGGIIHLQTFILAQGNRESIDMLTIEADSACRCEYGAISR